ncbi:MAG: hypothetical protein LPK07_00935 [Hymenobacteraceae bacterium]|nr:hypothetical protein [Hymenobacteraceae bacterium]
MKKYITLLALPFFILTSCETGPSEAEQKDELESTVMTVHDEAMAKMGDIYKMRRNLRTLRDTLEARQTDSTSLQALQAEISGLNQADEAMMQWMRNYSAPDTLQHEQAMTYLQQELEKIERVQIIMDSTLQAARATYIQYEQQK